MMGRSELCAWLRANSSGIYRPAAEAAEEIEHLAASKDQHFAQAMENGARANELRDALAALLALRRSLGHLTEYQTLVRSQGLDASSLTEGGQRMWATLQTYKQAYSRLRRLEQEEFKTWDAYNDTLLDANYRLLKEMLRGS